MPEYEVIKKGRLSAVNNIPVKAESYVITRYDGNLFILLKLRNKSRAVLNAVSLSISEYDDGGALLRTVSAEKDSLEEEGRFVFPDMIAAEEGCADIKVEVNRADYGSYRYEKKGKAAVLDYYDVEYNPPEYDASQREKKLKGNNFMVAVRKYKSPILLCFLAILIFACMAVFTWDQLTYFNSTEAAIIRENDVTYDYYYENGEPVGLVATGYSGLTGVVSIPATVNDYPVVGIEEGAFAGDTSITKITIKGEIEIESGMFRGCTSLVTANMTNVTSIGSYAFYGCTSLSTLKLGNDATIGSYAFYDCSALVSVDFTNISSVGSFAFYGCTSLLTVYSAKMVYIGSFAFGECTSLGQVDIWGDDSEALVFGNNAFENCSQLKTFVIALQTTYSSSGKMLQGCTAIESLRLYNLYTDTADKISLTDIFGSYPPQSQFSVTIENLGSVTSGICKGLNVSSFTAYSLDSTEIGASAFSDCVYLTEVTLPVTITSVGSYAFYNTAISGVDFSALAIIGSYAFAECDNITYAEFNNSETYLSTYAFYNSGLTTVVVRELKEVGSFAFYGCENLAVIYDYYGLGLTAGSTNYGYLAYYATSVITYS